MDKQKAFVMRNQKKSLQLSTFTLARPCLATSMLPPGTPGLCEDISNPLFSCALHHTRINTKLVSIHRHLGRNFMPSIGMKFRNR